jgi:hypothetical protein
MASQVKQHGTGTRPDRVRRFGLGRMVAFGLLSWAIVLAAALAMSPWRANNRPLFESALAVVLTATTALLAIAFYRRTPAVRGWNGLVLGLVWAAINVLLDLPLFSFGPLHMPPRAFLADIALGYLVMPVLTTALASQRRAGATAVVGSRPPAATPRPAGASPR